MPRIGKSFWGGLALDATAVIDFALHRVATFDSKRSLLGLSKRWCSRACLQQRAGRVGRVSAGVDSH